jgi:hypothetical protein
MLRISCDSPHPDDVKVVDEATGTEISNALALESIDIRMRVNEINSAVLSVAIVGPVHIKAQAEWRTKNPLTGEYDRLAAIEFADGTRLKFAAGGFYRDEPV